MFPGEPPFRYVGAGIRRINHFAMEATTGWGFNRPWWPARFPHQRQNLNSIPETRVSRNHDDAGFGHTEPAPVFFKVIADFHARRNVDVFVDNDSSQLGVTTNINTIHQDAIFRTRVAVDSNFWRQNGILDSAATDD